MRITYSAFSLLIVCALMTIFCNPAACQDNQSTVQLQDSAEAPARADVIILVMPASADISNIALVYQNRVPDNRVRSEINLLVKAMGGKLGSEIKIETKSLQPNNLQRFPARTGANFTLLNAPQVHDSTPVLTPYLAAFQSWNHIEVIFSLNDLIPYNGIERFDSDALTVKLIKDPGVYRYEVDIREHDKPLPALTVERKVISGNAGSPSSDVSGATITEKQPASSSSLPITLFLAGCAITGGVCVYLVLVRRSPVRASPRNIRR